jgi:hypothetical protein
VGIAVAYSGLAFDYGAGKLLVDGDFSQGGEPGAFVINSRGLAHVAMSCAKNDKGVDFRVLLPDCGKDNRGGRTAECPAGVRDDACDYCFRQRHIQGCFFEALVYLIDALVVLGGVELAGHNGFSILHIVHLSVAFATPGRYDYTIIRKPIYCKLRKTGKTNGI